MLEIVLPSAIWLTPVLGSELAPEIRLASAGSGDSSQARPRLFALRGARGAAMGVSSAHKFLLFRVAFAWRGTRSL